jgi:N-acyl-D-aspartate/D-glutamate deacylase
MEAGLTWDWESFPDYLDALEKREYDLDIAAQVPHAALRVQAMGERAAAHEQATPAEIAEMARLAREAVQAGAVGFTTSRSLNHKSVSGELTPSYDASFDELVAIARAVGETGKGSLQLITDYPDMDADFHLMREMVRASGRPLSVSLTHRSSEPNRYREVLKRITAANDAGLAIKAQVGSRGIGALLGLQCTLNPFIVNPVWKTLADLPIAEQAARMSEPALKAQILAAHTEAIIPNVIGGWLAQTWDQMFELSDPPNYEPSAEMSIAAISRRTGRTPQEVAYDVMLGDEGRAMLYVGFGWTNGSLDIQHELLSYDYSLPGLSDGGAHVGTICDGSFPTMLLQHWVRERDGDRLELPFVVQRQARDTARAVGMTDRGQLAPGFKADLNVIDLDRLHVHRPEMHFDLPGGGKRLLQRVDGYAHTFVGGVETYREGVATDALPGRLVRS